MKIDTSLTVGQIAAAHQETIPVFDKFKIDYCTQGSRSLKQACYLAGIPLEKIVREFEALAPPAGEWYESEPDWREKPMAELMDHIVSKHHVFTRRQLDLIEKLLEDLMESATLPAPGIARLRELFNDMSRDWRAHLLEEEKVVFPYLAEVEMAVQRGQRIPRAFQDLRSQVHPIRILQEENAIMGREWAKIREMTSNFDPPPGASQDVLDLYRAFQELEKDNRKHMHLENNLLFQKAKQWGALKEEKKNGNHYPQTAVL